MGIPGVDDRFQVVIDCRRHKLDEIHIRVELVERGFTGELKDLGGVRCSVEDKLKAVLDIRTVGGPEDSGYEGGVLSFGYFSY